VERVRVKAERRRRLSWEGAVVSGWKVETDVECARRRREERWRWRRSAEEGRSREGQRKECGGVSARRARGVGSLLCEDDERGRLLDEGGDGDWSEGRRGRQRRLHSSQLSEAALTRQGQQPRTGEREGELEALKESGKTELGSADGRDGRPQKGRSPPHRRGRER